jgi:hypothetical protein
MTPGPPVKVTGVAFAIRPWAEIVNKLEIIVPF